MKTDERKLPECLTRCLAEPHGRAVEPVRRPAGLGLHGQDRGSTHQALESLVLRGFVYVTSALVWLLVLGLVVRHAAR